MISISVRKLRYFVAIAEQGGFTQAASTLNVAQSALSRQVRELEAETGMQLFHRHGRGVSLTAEGKFFLSKCKPVLADIENFTDVLKRYRQGSEGPVTIGMPAVIAQSFIQPLVERTAVDFPELELRVTEGSSDFVEENLARGKLDIGVFYRVERAHGRNAQVLCHERLLLAFSSRWPGAKKAAIDRTALASIPMILPTRSHPLRRLIDSCVPGLTIKLEIDSLQTIKDLVISGHGCSILPQIGIYREREVGSISVSPIEEAIERTLFLAVSNRGPQSRHLGAVHSEIARHAEKMIALGHLL